MKVILTAIMVLMTIINVNAQEVEENTYKRVGFDYQYHFKKMNSLNETLTTSGYSPISEHGNYFNVYMKSGKQSSKWMGAFGFSYYERKSEVQRNITSPTVSPPIKTADIIGFGFSSGSEYRLVDTKYFFFNPLMSLDLEYYKLAFTENINFTSLGNILNSNIKTFSASAFQIPVRIGIRTGVNIPIKKQFISLGFTAGYKWHYANDDWKINDTVTIGSDINLSSLFTGVSMEMTMFPEE